MVRGCFILRFVAIESAAFLPERGVTKTGPSASLFIATVGMTIRGQAAQLNSLVLPPFRLFRPPKHTSGVLCRALFTMEEVCELASSIPGLAD